MAEDLAFLEVNHGLGDLRGMVSDPLDVPCGIHKTKPGIDALGMLDDFLLEECQDTPVVAIDLLLGGHNSLGPGDVGLGQGIKTIVNLVQGLYAQVLQELGDRECQRIGRELLDSLGNMAGQVGQAFEGRR